MSSLHVLGGLRIADGTGAPVTGRAAQRKRLALLALLAATPARSSSRDKLVGYLWPDADGERARHQLAMAIYELRRALGEDALRSEGDDVRLDTDAVAVDLVEFEGAMATGDLERAISIYRGPFLDGFFLSGCVEFEQWSEVTRDRIARRYAGALEAVAEQRANAGEPMAAADAWQVRAALDPLDGRVAHRLMEALEAAGDRAGAIRHAGAHAALLREELGAAPSPDIEALADRLRTTPNRAVIRADPHPRPEPAMVQPRRPDDAPAPARRRHIAPVALLVVVMAGGVALAARQNGASHAAADVPEPRPLLVAPLENRTGDPDLEPLGKIAADVLTRGIATAGFVEVIDPATGLFAARDAAADGANGVDPVTVTALARAASAATVVSGSYFRDGDSLRFQVQVNDAGSGRLLGAVAPVSGPAAQPLAALEELRERTIGAVGGVVDERVAGLRGTSGPLPSFEAYRDYIEGLEHFQLLDFAAAIPAFQRAAARDSSFVLPLFWMAFAYGATNRWADRDSLIDRLATRRDELPPLDRHALDYFQTHTANDFPAALRAVRRAAGLAPQSNWTYMVGHLAWRLNRPAEAIAALESLDPDRGWAQGWVAYRRELTAAYHVAGDHQRALDVARAGLERHPHNGPLWEAKLRSLAALGRVDELAEVLDRVMLDSPPPYALRVHAAVALHRFGHPERARHLFREVVALPGQESRVRRGGSWAQSMALVTAHYFLEDWDAALAEVDNLDAFPGIDDQIDPVRRRLRSIAWRGLVAARAGDRAGMEHALDRLETLRASNPRLAWGGIEYAAARIAAAAGDHHRALDLLRQAMERGLLIQYPFPWWPQVDPEWEPLRDDPRYLEIMKPRG